MKHWFETLPAYNHGGEQRFAAKVFAWFLLLDLAAADLLCQTRLQKIKASWILDNDFREKDGAQPPPDVLFILRIGSFVVALAWKCEATSRMVNSLSLKLKSNYWSQMWHLHRENLGPGSQPAWL